MFNPYVLLGIVLTVLGAFASGYYKGESDESARQQIEIAGLNTKAREAEQRMAEVAQTYAQTLRKANDVAKILNQKRNADLAAGVMRLRVPVSCPVQTSGDASVASGANIGTAELQPETAQALVAITDDADAAVRKLNTCINLYNQVRNTK